MRIVLLGPPGAGKGTVGEMLSHKYGIPFIGMGDLLRSEGKSGSEVGKRIKELIDRGIIIDTNTAGMVLKKRLNERDCREGFVLDGFPRTLEQVSEFNKIIEELAISIGFIFYIDKNIEESIKRISTRRTCKNCGTVYSLDFPEKKPKEINKCDKCYGELYQREDETPEAIRKRVEEYNVKTAPVIEVYDENGLLKRVRGETSKQAFENICSIIEASKQAN